ncbi:MAG: hypothetical protein IKO61_07125 [Lachnospiraceae bacterium]|nr:hypothetical protein [Lachnospiraceae bacterium]
MGKEKNTEKKRRSDFFEMVKYWTVEDYYNPGTKAEVIWDMLLSEFIPDIICFIEENKSNEDNRFKILAKEFPLKVCKDKQDEKDSKSLRNVKLDYLVDSPEYLYFVELKTTNYSFDYEQFERYCNYVGKDEDKKEEYKWCGLWGFYYKILESRIIQSFFGKTKIDNNSSENHIVHNKYEKQAKHIYEVYVGPYKDKEKDLFIKRLREKVKQNAKPIKLVYLLFNSIEFKKEKLTEELRNRYSNIEKYISFVSLKDLIKENTFSLNQEKSGTWASIKEIIEEIYRRVESKSEA